MDLLPRLASSWFFIYPGHAEGVQSLDMGTRKVFLAYWDHSASSLKGVQTKVGELEAIRMFRNTIQMDSLSLCP